VPPVGREFEPSGGHGGSTDFTFAAHRPRGGTGRRRAITDTHLPAVPEAVATFHLAAHRLCGGTACRRVITNIDSPAASAVTALDLSSSRPVARGRRPTVKNRRKQAALQRDATSGHSKVTLHPGYAAADQGGSVTGGRRLVGVF